MSSPTPPLSAFPPSPHHSMYHQASPLASPISSYPTLPIATSSRHPLTPRVNSLNNAPVAVPVSASPANPAGFGIPQLPFPTGTTNQVLGKISRSSQQAPIAAGSSSRQENEWSEKTCTAHTFHRGRICLIRCPWQNKSGCDAELASLELFRLVSFSVLVPTEGETDDNSQHLERIHFSEVRREAANRFGTARTSNFVRCHWHRCGEQYPITGLEYHVERDHLAALVEKHSLSHSKVHINLIWAALSLFLLSSLDSGSSVTSSSARLSNGVSQPWRDPIIRQEACPKLVDAVPRPTPPIPTDDTVEPLAFLASVQPFHQPPAPKLLSASSSIPLRRSRSSRSSQGKLQDVKDIIAPRRDEETPFWAVLGEATAGYRSGAATSSSIFPHPWYHNPLHRVDSDTEKLRKMLAAGRKVKTSEEIAVDEANNGKEDRSPLDSLQPPGNHDALGSPLVVSPDPAKPRRPPFVPPVDVYVAFRKYERKRKRAQVEKGRKGKAKAESERMVIDEKPSAFTYEQVTRAANRYSVKKARHSTGQGVFAEGIGFWQEKMRFERRGRKLGLIRLGEGGSKGVAH